MLKHISFPQSRDSKKKYTTREGDVHKALSKHPSIAQYVEHFMHGVQEVVVVAKYATDLQKMLISESLAGGDIQKYMKQLLEGVEFIHKKGYIHRDIKVSGRRLIV